MVCALLMTACASVNAPMLPVSAFTCRAPEPYIGAPGIGDLVEALNDTYLAWEDCSTALRRAGEAVR